MVSKGRRAGHALCPNQYRRRSLATHRARRAAEAGNPEAQRLLAWNGVNGHRVSRDTAAAALWFRKAAEQDDAGAQSHLAAMYCPGTGVVRTPTEAVRWYRRSAEQG